MKIENGISLKPPTPEARLEKQEKQLREAAKMYENHFMNQMVKAMRSTVGGDDGLVKKNMAEKIFTEQLDQQYVNSWSDQGGVGLADMIYNQIKEKYMGAATGKAMIPKGGLPIAPSKADGLPSTDSIQMKALPPSSQNQLKYRFEVQNPSGEGFEVQAPMAGKISDSRMLDQGWSTVTIDHGDGLNSEMTFPGRVSQNAAGTMVKAGQKLGVLDSARPVVAWNLDWT